MTADSQAKISTRRALRLTNSCGTRAVAAILCLILAFMKNAQAQGFAAVPLTAALVEVEIGGADDARAVISAVLAQKFPPGNRSRREFLLSGQVRSEWLPVVEGVEFVRLSDSEAATAVLNCGTYWQIGGLHRQGDVVSLVLSQKCRGGSEDTESPVTDPRRGAPMLAVRVADLWAVRLVVRV